MLFASITFVICTKQMSIFVMGSERRNENGEGNEGVRKEMNETHRQQVLFSKKETWHQHKVSYVPFMCDT